MIRKWIRHIRVWNIWRKNNTNGRLHHLLVLLKIVHSPTMQLTVLPEELTINSAMREGEAASKIVYKYICEGCSGCCNCYEKNAWLLCEYYRENYNWVFDILEGLHSETAAERKGL